MSESLRALLPLIATCVTIAALCFAFAAYESWKRWPKQGAPSEYGAAFNHEEVRRITEQADRR